MIVPLLPEILDGDPPEGRLKLNVDAAVKANSCRAAVAVVVRDSNGAMLTGTTCRFYCNSVMRAEAEAMLEAVNFAITLGIKDPIFEGDNLLVVKACNGISSYWQASPVLDTIFSLLPNFSSFTFTWVPRQGNMVADLVAGMALNLSLPLIWSWIPPVKIRAVVLNDLLVFESV